MSNFGFLKPFSDWQEITQAALDTEKFVYSDHRTSCFYARLCIERVVKEMYRIDGTLNKPYDNNLAAMLHESSFRATIPSALFPKLKLIQKVGNRAVHSDGKISMQESLQVIKELHHCLYWFARIYAPTAIEDQFFSTNALPQTMAVDVQIITQSAAQLKKLQKQIEEREEKAEKDQAELLKKNAELAKQNRELLEQIQKQTELNKAANQASADSHDFNEAQTRHFLIDEMLKEMGWDIESAEMVGNASIEAQKATDIYTEVTFEHPVDGMPNESGMGFVDYVLWGEDRKPLAVVEAKRTSISPLAGKQQAKLYADCLEQLFKQRPLIYYSNGYETYFWDDKQYPERQVQGFRSRDELQRLVNRRSERVSLIGQMPNEKIANRPYQIAAIANIFQVFETDNQRKALLVMATGTGKTRTAISLVELLSKNTWIKHALFLADRNALLNQAKKNFTKLLPHTSPTILSGNSDSDDLASRICFATYPTMMNLLSSPPNTRLFGVGHFDLIIVDEAHRSIFKKYRHIFEYFDALLVGLTATPKDDIDKNTYDIFDLEKGVPTYAYDYRQAVDDRHLVDFVALDVPVGFVRKGVKYDELSEEEKEQWDEKESLVGTNEVLPSEMNKILFNASTVDIVLHSLMKHGIKVDGGDTLGKTIIFAANNKHAEFILKRFDHHYAKYKGQFARVITYQEKYAQSLIDEFSKEASDLPKNAIPLNIAISVDMLDTGIDVPAVVNLVFFKPVHSRVKFDQMIGRGTRLCENLFGPGEHKTQFKVFDVCDNFSYFKQKPEGAKDTSVKPISQLIFEKRLLISQKLNDIDEQDLHKLREHNLNVLHHTVAGMNLDNFIVRPKRKMVESFLDRKVWQSLTEDQLNEVITHISSLPTDASPFDEFEQGSDTEKRFDNLMLTMQLEYLQTNVLPENLRLKLVEIARQLETKSSIPLVKAKIKLIEEMQTEDFWVSISVLELESIRRDLRSLIEHLDKEKKEIVYTNFADQLLGPIQEIDKEELYASSDMLAQYRKKVTAFIQSHEDELTIQRLKRNLPITQTALDQLDELLFTASEMQDREAYRAQIHPEKSLGEFIRSVVGLDRGSIQPLFSAYLNKTQYNAVQIQFIDEILNSLCINGTLAPAMLYSPPFTDIHHDSVFAVFENEAMNIVNLIKSVNDGVMPKDDVA